MELSVTNHSPSKWVNVFAIKLLDWRSAILSIVVVESPPHVTVRQFLPAKKRLNLPHAL